MSRIIRSQQSGMDYHFSDDWLRLEKRTVGRSGRLSSDLSPLSIGALVVVERGAWPPVIGEDVTFSTDWERFSIRVQSAGPPSPNSQDGDS